MKSAIYKGWVRHRRYFPKQHQLRYQVFMLLLDLAELDQVFSDTAFWSTTRWAPARFKREDFFGDPSLPLDAALRQHVKSQTGVYPTGPIRMLANLRYFGFIINPITCYYCFDDQEQLQYIVAEVNNTPWNERHAYVLPCEPERKQQRIDFYKCFHVSPFNPMDIRYFWRSSHPGESLSIHMQNWRDIEQSGSESLEFDATLSLQRETISAQALNKLIWQYPLMTGKVVLGIYWQALKLFIKGVPIFDHPKKQLSNG